VVLVAEIRETSALRPELLEIVRRHLRFARETEDWEVVRLVDLGLDSMSAIELVLDLEETLGILFPDDVLVAETFETASTLQAVVSSLEDSPL
jgi:acyl carrier protein